MLQSFKDANNKFSPDLKLYVEFSEVVASGVPDEKVSSIAKSCYGSSEIYDVS